MILNKIIKEGIEIATIESSNICRSYYEPTTQDLIIEFIRGGKYSYKPVPQHIYNKFLESPSQGKFFVNEIKNNKWIDCNKV
jgi:hypothetical protein